MSHSELYKNGDLVKINIKDWSSVGVAKNEYETIDNKILTINDVSIRPRPRYSNTPEYLRIVFTVSPYPYLISHDEISHIDKDNIQLGIL